MSVQSTIGTGLMAVVLAAILNTLGVATAKESYIEIHGLEFEINSGVPYVIQKRTVQVDGRTLTARWEAVVYTIEGTQLVEQCSGSGGWDYEEGYRDAKIPFDKWVGQAGCYDGLPDNAKVKLYGRYKWGVDGSTEKRSDQIVIDKSISQ